MTNVPVPARLVRPHTAVAATRQAAEKLKPEADGRIRVGPRPGVVPLVVSPAQLARTLRILEGVLRETLRRGFAVVDLDGHHADARGVAVEVESHRYRIQIIELNDRIPLTPEETRTWDEANQRRYSWERQKKTPTHRSVANGRLRLLIPPCYEEPRRHQWTDGRRGTLEHQLPKFFEELSGRVDADNAWRAKIEERRHRSEEEARLRLERQRLAEIERSLVDRLRGEISVWQLADDARRYVSALRERRSTSSPEDSTQLDEWCAWIERWIAANDPTTNVAIIPRADLTND